MEKDKGKKKFISVIKKGEVTKVYTDDILYISSCGRKISIYTDEKIHSMYRKLCEIDNLTERKFYKCHHSLVINLEKVVSMKEGVVTFENGERVFTGRDSFVKALQSYKNYLIANEKNR